MPVARSKNADDEFTGDHHQWRVDRPSRTFVVRVVEPRTYNPASHAEVFRAVLNQLLQPEPAPVDPFQAERRSNFPEAIPEPFDLVTFPEAFAPVEALVDGLQLLYGLAPRGCVHTGLRKDCGNHLFPTEDLLEVAERIASVPGVVGNDLDTYREWARARAGEPRRHFNLGCLFGRDADGQIRVCLHPKVVRSKFESAPLPEHHMEEAAYLALVTLRPTDRRFFSVTLQPLLCSDALNLTTDKGHAPPIQAVNECAECFANHPPDHVDIISLATCTPQTPITAPPELEWHEQFRSAFLTAAGGGRSPRHHHAVFVLANFLKVTEKENGGLSGAFVPMPLKTKTFGPEVSLSRYGHPQAEGGANRWSTDAQAREEEWRTRGFIAGLNPTVHSDAAVRIFEFTLQRLPRDNTPWTAQETLARCEVQIGRRTADGQIIFGRRESGQ